MSKHERNIMRLEIIGDNNSHYSICGVEAEDIPEQIAIFKRCYKTRISLLLLHEYVEPHELEEDDV